jgi:hypothetical protein
MALPPIQFQRPRRDPSLVEQAFVGTLASLANRKLVAEPAEREQRAFQEKQNEAYRRFATSEREAGQAFTTARDAAEAQRRREEMNRTAFLNAQAAEAQQPDVSVIQSLGQSLAEATSVDMNLAEPGVQFAMPGATVDLSGLFPGAGTITVPNRRGGMASLDALARQRALQLQERDINLRSKQLAQSDRDYLDRMLAQYAVDPSKLPPALYKTSDGEYRLLHKDEERLRAFGMAAKAGELAGYANDQRVQDLITRTADLDAHLVVAPSYSPETELDFLGKLATATPSSTMAGQAFGLFGVLQSAGMLGDEWFRNDQGEIVKVKNAEQLLARVPSEAQSRLKGALWARVFFPSEEQYAQAKVLYGLSDPVAEQTYRTILGLPTPAAPARPGEGQEATGLTHRGKAEGYQTPVAKRLVAGDENARGTLDSYVDAFVRDSTLYETATKNVDRLLSLDDQGMLNELERIGVVPPEEGGHPGVGLLPLPQQEPPRRQVPDRDRLRLNLYNILEAARIEAQAVRKARRAAAEGTLDLQ